MTDRPLTIVGPQLKALIAGTLTALRRPPTRLYQGVAPGDRFWIREPFYLDERWNGLAPLAAIPLGALPTFEADLPHGRSEPGLGRRRMGRILPRTWHRQHITVERVERQRIQAIGEGEIIAAGFASRAAFAADWDRNLTMLGAEWSWSRDPDVLVLHFNRHANRLEERLP